MRRIDEESKKNIYNNNNNRKFDYCCVTFTFLYFRTILLCKLARERILKKKKGRIAFSPRRSPAIYSVLLSRKGLFPGRKIGGKAASGKREKGGQRKGWKSVRGGRGRRESRRSAFKIMRSLLYLLSPSLLHRAHPSPPRTTPCAPRGILLPRSSHFSSLLPFFFPFFLFRAFHRQWKKPLRLLSKFDERRGSFRRASTIVIKIQRFVD